MTLVPYDKSLLKTNTYRFGDNYRIVTEFKDSGLECARIDGFTQQDAYSCAKTLNQLIRRYKFGFVRAIVRDGDVYLIRTE